MDPALGHAFKQQYLTIKGRPVSTQWTEQDAIAAMKDVFSHLP